MSDLTDAVAEDTSLTPAEKETSITFTKPDDTARVFTAEAGLMRRLLSHPEFTVAHVVPADGAKVQNVEQLDAADTRIVGVAGTIPIGCLKVQSNARDSGGHATVVSYSGGD